MYPVYRTRNLIGHTVMIEEVDSIAWSRFEKTYQALVGRVLAGEVFEVPVSAVPQLELEHQRPRQMTAPGDVRAHLKALRERLRLR